MWSWAVFFKHDQGIMYNLPVISNEIKTFSVLQSVLIRENYHPVNKQYTIVPPLNEAYYFPFFLIAWGKSPGLIITAFCVV